MNIRTRLTLAFSGLALIVLLVAGLSWSFLGQGNERFSQFVTGVNARAQVAARLRNAVDQRAVAARNLVLVTKPADRQAEQAIVTSAHESVGRSLSQLKAMVAQASDASAKARELVTQIDAIEKSYGAVALAIVDLATKDRKEEAIAKMNDECRPLLAALVKATDDYAEVAATHAAELIKEAAAGYAVQRALLFAAGLFAIMAAFVCGWLITRSIVGPVNRAVQLAECVAAGDLTRAIESQGQDEIARLLNALGTMRLNLAGIVREVRSSTENIATGSAQIAMGNADLSQRTEQQASSLQETAASMEELSGTVRQSADTAAQANLVAGQASTAAKAGGKAVNQVVATMEDIATSSRKIADIIAVIDGIAFQTNILALNAAVEAARAGEQGRGFAVVASEVRALAGRSSEAAREIKSLIGASVEKVEVGARQVHAAGQLMGGIVTQVEHVSQLISEISGAAVEQSGGIAQVGQAVTDLDRVTQQNAALVEESAAAAASLKGQAQQLVQAVAVFKLSHEGQLAATGR